MTQPKRIPYGVADYGRFRRENCYYVDKTHFIPLVEAAPFYLFFIRPRRFGKTLWLSVLEHYMDGEKVIQGFLLAYLNVTHHFLPWSESEMGGAALWISIWSRS